MSLGSQKEKRDIRIVPIVGFVLLVFIFLELLSQGITYFHYGKPYKSMDPYSFSGYGVYRQNSNYNHKDFVHNSQGFRNIKEFPVERVKGKVRILLAGASVLYAGSAFTNIGWSKRVATKETISFYLSELLNKDYKDKNIEIEVINAGVNRHRIRETLSYLTSELGKYRPDIAIIIGT